MFSKEDFVIEDMGDFLEFLLILPFVGLVAPFLIAAYTLGFVSEITGRLKS
jgi:hypothetical protein